MENLAWKQVAIKPPKNVKNLSGGQESQYLLGIQQLKRQFGKANIWLLQSFFKVGGIIVWKAL